MRLYPFILAAACRSAPAFAVPMEDERRRESVSLAEVRFDDPRSVAELRRKIVRVVRRVCAPDGMRIDNSVHVRSCRIGAQEGADRQLAQFISQPKLAAIEPR